MRTKLKETTDFLEELGFLLDDNYEENGDTGFFSYYKHPYNVEFEYSKIFMRLSIAHKEIGLNLTMSSCHIKLNYFIIKELKYAYKSLYRKIKIKNILKDE